MDLIYANSEFEDIGVVQDFILDMAYGQTANAENSFEVKMVLQKPECEAGYYLYIEHTEYGGIIDAIGADTKDNYLTYRGRTWHGILDSKIIEPAEGQNFYAVSGEANSVVAELIEHCGLDDIFEVSSENSGIDIDYFEFGYGDSDDRVYLNMGLFIMLQKNDAKLKIVCENKKVKLHVERLMNYATDEFDSSQMKFSLTKVFSHVNHLILLGKEDERRWRPIIHLFAGENGEIQQYLISDDPDFIPLEDSDYILDKSMQVYTGIDERAEVCDYPELGTIENYKPLDTQPSDWKKNYTKYYEKKEEDEEDEYVQVEANIQESYSLTESKPTDWNDGYMNYYTRDYNEDTGEDVYSKVPEEVDYTYTRATRKPTDWNEIYTRYFIKTGSNPDTYDRASKVPRYKAINKQPKDWEKNYSNYYTSDGVNYNSISGVPKVKKVMQTKRPENWATDWKTANWYIKRNGHYVKLGDDHTLSRRTKAPAWKSKTYYSNKTVYVTPSFKAFNQVYSMTLKIPTWSGTNYYTRKRRDGVYPAWEAYKYYRRNDDIDLGIEFEANAFYEKVFDHYAKLVEKGIEVIDDFNDRDELAINFEENAHMYDIGDMVGGEENVTSLRVAQPIVKKIINIENNFVKIQHLIREVKEWQ